MPTTLCAHASFGSFSMSFTRPLCENKLHACVGCWSLGRLLIMCGGFGFCVITPESVDNKSRLPSDDMMSNHYTLASSLATTTLTQTVCSVTTIPNSTTFVMDQSVFIFRQVPHANAHRISIDITCDKLTTKGHLMISENVIFTRGLEVLNTHSRLRHNAAS
eukprot:4998708-Amphidinium_carterae.1